MDNETKVNLEKISKIKIVVTKIDLNSKKFLPFSSTGSEHSRLLVTKDSVIEPRREYNPSERNRIICSTLE